MIQVLPNLDTMGLFKCIYNVINKTKLMYSVFNNVEEQ